MDKKAYLHFSVTNPESSNKSVYLPFILYIAIVGVFTSILEIGFSPIIIIGLGIIVIEIILPKKILVIFNITLIILLSLCIIGNLNGIKLLCNQLFLISEKYQAYKYFIFSVDSETGLNFAYAIFTMIFAITASLTAQSRSVAAVAINFLLITGFEIYFGVFGSSLWNIFLYITFVLLLINRKSLLLSNNLIIIGAVIISFITVGLFFNYDNPEISVLSEQIRDLFDEQIQSDRIPDPENINNQIKEDQFDKNDFTNSDGESNVNEFQTNTEYTHSGSEAGLMNPPEPINRLLYLLLITAASVILWTAVYLYKKTKRNRQFTSANYAAAVNSMFLYIIRLYKLCGLTEFDGLRTKFHGQLYADAVDIWYESLYSDHEITDSHRDKMRAFLNETVGIIYKKIEFSQKLKIKFIHFL